MGQKRVAGAPGKKKKEKKRTNHTHTETIYTELVYFQITTAGVWVDLRGQDRKMKQKSVQNKYGDRAIITEGESAHTPGHTEKTTEKETKFCAVP